MYTTATLLATLTALTSLATAAPTSRGTLFVDNRCNFPLYLQSKASNVSPGPLITLPAGRTNAYNEIERDPSHQTNAITISRTPDLASPIQFVYSQETSGLDYYSMSTKFGDPLRAQGFEVLTSGGGYQILCPPRGSGDCPNTYSPSNPNGNGAVFSQENSGNFVIRTCMSNGVV